MDDLLTLLTEGEITLRGLLPYGSNYTFLADVHTGDRRAAAVYKPSKGEQPLWDFPPETLAHREAAAYVVSEALGWSFVPPTVLRRDGPYGRGSLQWFVDADPELHYLILPDDEKRALGRVMAFDVLLNNADRKSGHVLKDSHGKIWLIDHGLCFHHEPKLRTVIWELAGEPLPADLLSDLCNFSEKLGSDPALGESLSGLLAASEIRALQRRAAALVEAARYPLPGPGRNYPWPPV